ncbi:unnamed protein product [Dovyalis caffra]|uniref:F-box domain-containing protein n=1 Tax=Dovyalis caffra TaxID=77055 RepID=A0AAV1RPZ7_9ROSI|nr:unnamed protein product [Dovyalis caffra]
MDDKRKRAASTAESKCLVAELPHGLITDILSRLPVKSLFNCKFVCKTWLRLISDPHFAKIHWARSPTTFLIQDTRSRYKESTDILLVQIVEEVIRKTFEIESIRFVPNTNLPDTGVDILNSCNGLVCCWGMSKGIFNDMVYVCNPILGECISIPVVKKVGKRKKCGQYFALGFSTASNQYKVLHTFYLGREFVTQCRAEIYTVGTGQWRRIGNAPFSLDYLNANVFLHDSIHWVDYDPENYRFICAFDFEFEKFKRLSLPPDSQIHDGKGRHSVSCVGVLKGCLFMAFDVCSECGEFEIWVMEEYGVKESWSKKFVVGNVHLNDYVCYEPLFFLSSGEILMLHEDQCIVRYDARWKSFQDLTISQGIKSIKVIAYSPSFVSLQDIAQGEEVKVLR